MKRVLTIAGSDSGGGAGLQADLKTFAALGCHGMSAVVAVTAQNTVGVQGFAAIDEDLVEAQIDAVLTDLGVDAIKTGMLASASMVRCVARKLEGPCREEGVPLVVDPVMVATSGDSLVSDAVEDALIEHLFPLAHCITPNLAEAAALTGASVKDLDSMRAAALALHRRGPRLVLIKGGHLSGPPIDLLYDGEEFVEIRGQRIDSRNTHGTGCVYAAALAAYLARGESPRAAVGAAHGFVERAIRLAEPLGEGHGPVQPTLALTRSADEASVLGQLVLGLERLAREGDGSLIPEVQSNLAFALPGAGSWKDVAAFPGRIVSLDGRIHAVALPRLGASRHIARVVLTAMATDPEIRCCLNVRYRTDIEACAHDLGLVAAGFSRKDEPEDVRKIEGSTLEWGTARVLEGRERVPDLIHDPGGEGKEPMIRILGRDPAEVVDKALRLGKKGKNRED